MSVSENKKESHVLRVFDQSPKNFHPKHGFQLQGEAARKQRLRRVRRELQMELEDQSEAEILRASDVKKKPGWLGYTGDESYLPIYRDYVDS